MPEISEVEIKVSTKGDTSGIEKVEDKFKLFSSSAVQSSAIIGAGLLGVGTALAGVGVKAVQTFAKVEQSQIAFTTLLGDAGKATALVKQIQKDAAETPFEFQGLIDMNQKLIGSGMSAEQARKTVLSLGDALSATGAGSAEMSRVGNTISQVFGKGKADAVDFKELVNAGWVSVKKDTADAMGVTMQQFEDLVSAGEVDFNILQGALAKVTGEGGKFHDAMKRQSQSVAGLWSTLKDNVNIALAEIGQKLFETFHIGDMIKSASDAIAGFTATLTGTIIPFFEKNAGLIPIFAGTIMAMLVPALVALAGAAWAALAPVLLFAAPFIAIGAAVAALYLAFNNNFLGIRDIVFAVVDWFQVYVMPTLMNVFNFIGSVLTTLGQIFMNVFNLIIKPLIGAFVLWFNASFVLPIKALFDLVTLALNKMGLSWSDVWNGIKKLVFGILDAIVNEVKSKINFVINAINALINGANSIGGKISGYTKINTIPTFAQGVQNFKGGLALVGERGAELVNLPRGSDVIPNDKIGGVGGIVVNQNNNIYEQVDMNQAYRELGWRLSLGI